MSRSEVSANSALVFQRTQNATYSMELLLKETEELRRQVSQKNSRIMTLESSLTHLQKVSEQTGETQDSTYLISRMKNLGSAGLFSSDTDASIQVYTPLIANSVDLRRKSDTTIDVNTNELRRSSTVDKENTESNTTALSQKISQLSQYWLYLY